MLNVLIADDSIAVRKVAERLLSEAGFGVTLAANGEEALAYLAKETPDLVVSFDRTRDPPRPSPSAATGRVSAQPENMTFTVITRTDS